MSTKIPHAATLATAGHLDRLMRRIHARLQTRAESFDIHGLGPNASIVLLSLNDIAPASIHALVTRVARDKSQITRTVKMLESKGLVTRAADSSDGRVTVLSLTDLGDDAVLRIQSAVAEILDELFADLSASQRQTLHDILSGI